MTSSPGGARKSVGRCNSDSGAIIAKTEQRQNDFVNRSVESVNAPSNNRQQQQLLRLSFFNSPNSPINSNNYPSMADRISQEAKKISRQFAVSRSTDSSFEDLNNISQSLVDNSMESINDDFKEMKVDKIDIKSEPEGSPIANKIAMFQEQLKRIKQETVDVENYEFRVKIEEPSPIKIPDSPSPEKPSIKKEKADIDIMMTNLKDLFAAGKKEEAKRQLGKLSELLTSQSEPKTIQVQPMIREDTFEIDKSNGKRIYNNNKNMIRPNQSQTPAKKAPKANELLEKIQSLIDPEDVKAVEIKNDQIVFTVQKDLSTPMKNPRLSTFSTATKPTNMVRGTPMTKSVQNAGPRNSFTAPRQVRPYEQKLGAQRANPAKKTLQMDKSTMEKSPNTKTAKVAPTQLRPATVRRSVSYKESSAASKQPILTRPSTVKKTAEVANSNLTRPATTTSSSMKQPSSVKSRSTSTKVSSMRPKKQPASDQGSLV